MSRPRILFIMHMPPPVHGASVMGGQLRDSARIREAFETEYLNLSASASLDEIGKGGLRKVSYVFRLLRQVRQILREWKPDLVYVTPTSTLPALAKDYLMVRLVRRYRCRIALHFHNKGVAARSGRWLDNWVYRHLFDGAEVILLSDLLRPDVDRYVPSERISICANGLDLPGGVTRNYYRDNPQLLFLSNLLPDKGIVDLLDACSLLHGRGYAFTCRFVGAPTPALSTEDFRRMVTDRGLDDLVSYDGPRYGQEKQAVWEQADIFVHPTREDCFPLVILEAMAAALPVVSTHEGGIADEVEEGVSGLFCEKANPKSLADAIARLLTDPSLRESMGHAGRERYERYFTATCFERRMLEILRSYV